MQEMFRTLGRIGPNLITREMATVGPFVQHVLHETALAVFDNLEVPVWGRLHDAADYSAAFLLFQFGPDVARKTIFGTAYFLNQWDSTIREGQITDVNYLGDIRPTVRQRYYNLLCIAVGKDPIGFSSFIALGRRALVGGGHALLLGVPGLAKTKLVDTMGTVLGLDARRIQFTPDLMPSDILGTEVLEESQTGKRSFRFISGPVFAQLLMADEINRASPRTQSALLQAMQEQHVTVAGTRHDLHKPFHVLATHDASVAINFDGQFLVLRLAQNG